MSKPSFFSPSLTFFAYAVVSSMNGGRTVTQSESLA